MATKPAKLLKVFCTFGSVSASVNGSPVAWNASLSITPQPHSSLTFGNGGFYDGRDVKVGDWVSTSNSGACLRVKSVTSQTAGTVACVLEDAHGAMNAALDPNQGGDSAIPNGVGVLFEEVGGMPVIFPLPDALPGNFTSTFAQQLVNRFFMANGGFGGQAAAITIGAITGLPSTTTVQNALEKVLPLAGGTMTGALTLSGDPTVDLHAATKKYVDNMVTGLGPKSAVRVATIGNITLSGGQTIDGISVTTGDRVLVKNQTTSSKNGIYVVDPSTWTRAADANTTAELVGAHCFVAEGTVNADTGWVCTANSTDILEASVVSWKQFSGPGMAASNGVRVATIGNITLSGGQTIDGISVATGDRVLVKNQTTPSQNGIYVVAPTTWTRAADLDSWGEFPGAFVFVEQGTVNKDTGWVCTSDQGGTVDTTAVTWTQFSGPGLIVADPTKLPLSGGVMTGNLTLYVDPMSAMHAATKQYVDTVATGLTPKGSVRVATTANITLSGSSQTIDGVSVGSSVRVLVKNQTVPSQNGIYEAASGAWTRVAEMSYWGEFPGAFVFVEQGTVNKDTGWVCTSDQGGTVDTTAVTWTQFSGAGTVTAGSGISISGMQVSLATSGVTPSTYRSVSVDAYGRVTAGTNPTTISGYGITDALTLGLTAGAAAGTAAAGTAATAARSDHVHPAQTTITGNAATATKLQTAVNIAGVPFDGSANIAIPFTNLTGNIIANSAVKLKRPDTVNTIVDVSAGNVFTKTVTGATTFTLQNKSGDSVVDSFILEVINGGGHVITWWSDVKWAGGVAPTLTVSGKDVLGFYSHDGSSWIGTVIAKNVL